MLKKFDKPVGLLLYDKYNYQLLIYLYVLSTSWPAELSTKKRVVWTYLYV